MGKFAHAQVVVRAESVSPAPGRAQAEKVNFGKNRIFFNCLPLKVGNGQRMDKLAHAKRCGTGREVNFGKKRDNFIKIVLKRVQT
jgi:hypothetical protein